MFLFLSVILKKQNTEVFREFGMQFFEHLVFSVTQGYFLCSPDSKGTLHSMRMLRIFASTWLFGSSATLLLYLLALSSLAYLSYSAWSAAYAQR